jgi:hypothetical protein
MKVAALVTLMLAIGLCAMPARADTLVRVTVRGPDGSPAGGVAVTLRQAAGYGAAPVALVGAAATDSDGAVSFHLAGVQPSDVYSISADDRLRGRHAAAVVIAIDGREAAAVLTLDDAVPAETKAGVEMLARCPPGWQVAQQQIAQASCHRSSGTGRERS